MTSENKRPVLRIKKIKDKYRKLFILKNFTLIFKWKEFLYLLYFIYILYFIINYELEKEHIVLIYFI